MDKHSYLMRKTLLIL